MSITSTLLDVTLIHQRFYRSLDSIEHAVVENVASPTPALRSALASGRRTLAHLLRDERALLREWALRDGLHAEDLPGAFCNDRPSMTGPTTCTTVAESSEEQTRLWEIRVLLKVRNAKQNALATAERPRQLRKDLGLIDREVARLRALSAAVGSVSHASPPSPPPAASTTATPARRRRPQSHTPAARSIRAAEASLATPAGVSTRSFLSATTPHSARASGRLASKTTATRARAQSPRISPALAGAKAKRAAAPRRVVGRRIENTMLASTASQGKGGLAKANAAGSSVSDVPKGLLGIVMRGPNAGGGRVAVLVPPQGEKGRTETASGKRAVASRRGGRPLLSPLRAARPPPLPFALASFFEMPVSAGGRARVKQQRGVSTRAPPNSA